MTPALQLPDTRDLDICPVRDVMVDIWKPRRRFEGTFGVEEFPRVAEIDRTRYIQSTSQSIFFIVVRKKYERGGSVPR